MILISSIIDGLETLFRIGYIDYEKENFEEAKPSNDFTILMPTYNSRSYIEEILSKMKKYQEKILIVDDASEDETVEKVKEFGFRVIQNPQNGKKIGAINFGLNEIDTSYTIIMDSDSWTNDNICKLIGYVKENNLDGCAVKILPEQVNLLTSLQLVEYARTMSIGRGSMDEKVQCVSGAFGVFRTELLREVTEKQIQDGIEWEGEDFERTLRILRKKGKVKYLEEFTAWTKAPETIEELTKQRIGWDKGYLRCHLDYREFLRSADRLGLTFLFNFVINMIAHPFKLLSIPFLFLLVKTNPLILLVFYISYIILEILSAIVSYPKDLSILKYAFLMPFYNLYNLIVPRTFGYFKEIKSRFFIWRKMIWMNH